MKPTNQQTAEIQAFRVWSGILNALLDAAKQERPDAEEAAAHFDMNRTPREAMALILAERGEP